MITADEIATLLRDGLPDAQITVRGDDGQHFEAEIVSPAFRGLSMLAQHRLAYEALGDRMGREIHALSLTTRAPADPPTAQA